MKIGIISDTHDDIENVSEAIQIFNQNKVKYVIHAGDYIFPGIIKEFSKLNAKLIGVFGKSLIVIKSTNNNFRSNNMHN